MAILCKVCPVLDHDGGHFLILFTANTKHIEEMQHIIRMDRLQTRQLFELFLGQVTSSAVEAKEGVGCSVGELVVVHLGELGAQLRQFLVRAQEPAVCKHVHNLVKDLKGVEAATGVVL